MATPPTRVSYNVPTSGNFSSTTSPKTTASFDVVAGDLIVVLCSIESAFNPSSVTPSASGGSVTWTSRATQNAGGSNQSAAYCWTGAVGATATGITVSLNRPTTDATLFWGMSATLWRNHGGVGTTFSGSNGTGSGAPSVASAAACAANSAVMCQVNDWNAADGTSRVWRTINGAAESESTYFRDSARHTVYGGYRTDTGAAGSITQGLTAPSTQRWVLVGVEILGATGGTTVVGASRATTWHVRATVAGSRATTWRFLATAAASRATTWRVRATTLASRATTWRVLTTATSSRATSWHVRAVAAAQRSTSWRALANAVATRATTWRTLERTASTRQTTWNVLSSLISVGASRATSWRVLASATSTRAATWNVKATIAATRSTLWDVLTATTVSRATTWRVLAGATATRSTLWRVVERVTAVRVAMWSVEGLESGFQGRIIAAHIESENHASGSLDAERHITARLSIPEVTGVLS